MLLAGLLKVTVCWDYIEALGCLLRHMHLQVVSGGEVTVRANALSGGVLFEVQYHLVFLYLLLSSFS